MIIVIALLWAVVASSHALGLSGAEKQALLDLYNATGGSRWRSASGWATPADPCSWFSVACDAANNSVV
jgi:hypothetical protein